MKFGRTLRKSIYPPWKDKYIDYDKLKKLLKETDGSTANDQDEEEWTEEDEGAFVEELVNVQLEKVHEFQAETYKKLREQTSQSEASLDPLAVLPKEQDSKDADQKTESQDEKKSNIPPEEREKRLKDVLKELDSITKEVNELERYSRINYTGFLKSAKKHDRKRGHSYRVRPLLQVRLAALPFNKEDYSPLLYRLSAMYSFVRQSLDPTKRDGISFSDSQTGGESFTSYKFWVHPENLLEVKTVILRRLPVLVYNPQTSKVAEGSQKDPKITSIYFDNPSFSLYDAKLNHEPNAPSLRLRWYGKLAEKPEIILEEKIIKDGDASEERRFPIKEKYIEPFLKGDYSMEKSVKKLQDRYGEDSDQVAQLQNTVNDIQEMIKEKELQPFLRASYTRTAFQIPGDDRVRISLDTELALIREDAIDHDRPCRDPEDWHRLDVDDFELEYPFEGIRKGEISRFPFALLEIKIKGKKQYEWVSELMDSHLVKEAPRFSKFVHGVAVLFEDYVNTFPFWLSQLESDIRRDPHKAFEEEQERKAKAAEDEMAIGSLLGGRSPSGFRASISSPVGTPAAAGKSDAATSRTPSRAMTEITRRASQAALSRSKSKDRSNVIEEEDSDDDGQQGTRDRGRDASTLAGLRALFPTFSTSKYARAQRVKLPPGVEDPGVWIKDQGPVRVEAKVWLANQRTFVKWQHVSVLMASLSLGLYNAAGAGNDVARNLAVAYTLVAVFTGAWGWGVFVHRSRLIERRSGKDLDFVLGPVVVCVGLVVALCFNFAFRYRAFTQDHRRGGNTTANAAPLRPWNGEL